MPETIDFLLRHGYSILFAVVFAEQLGFPVPSPPFLLTIGALATENRFSFAPALALSILAALPADAAWFYLGRRRGYGVLRVLCRISLEPESCVNSASDAFHRHGGRALLAAKFIPGLSTVAP